MSKPRKIIHIDMDCFFAAVEMRENPALSNLPIAVGGSSDRRGVLSTCNYLARKYGVRSAMATAHALKLCPDLVVVPGSMALYKSISQQIRDIFLRYTPLIEPLSLDEAYLDVSDCKLFQGSATLIAESIRRDIEVETGLTASAGVAPNKFIAKIASDENKPNGICVIPPHKVSEFVDKLPLRKIPGVGKVTAEKLKSLGLNTTADVRSYPFDGLEQACGKLAKSLLDKSHGIDDRELSLDRVRKSVGVEHTLSHDIYSRDQVLRVIKQLLPELNSRFAKHKRDSVVHKQVIKLKFDDFKTTTIEKISPTLNESLFSELLTGALLRQENRGIRLVGISLGLAKPQTQKQMVFDFL
ncbi:DNA polymerase IV [Algibacillus agarilyticus]|uniref:DNA polymerase IV n=1 Tax=Algibacillus agarilyticus TaxID=2234133 RepID=UPI000DD03849|nr:DNA polymerase IV [Algibacillus agarilyticus]